MAEVYFNNAWCKLTATLYIGQTTMQVDNAAPFGTLSPGDWFRVSVWNEVVKVTDMSGTGNTTWTVERELEGVTSGITDIGTVVVHQVTAGMMSDLPPGPQGPPGTSGLPGISASISVDLVQQMIDDALQGLVKMNNIPIAARDWQDVAGTGITYGWDTAYGGGSYVYHATPANADSFGVSVWTQQGTYDLKCRSPKAANKGIMELFVDGVSQGTIDMYDATGFLYDAIWRSIKLEEGNHTLQLKVNSKNGSSSSYVMLVYGSVLQQVA